MNSNINIQLLHAVMVLAQQLGKPLCYNTTDGNIYEVKQKDSDCATLLALGGVGDAPIYDFSVDKLIFAENFENALRSGINGILSENNGVITDWKQSIAQTFNSAETDSAQAINGSATAAQQHYISAGKVNLPRFSSIYSGETFSICVQIEALLEQIFAATNKPQTIQKTIENYDRAVKLAKAGKLYELKQLAERLQGRIAKQTAMQKGKDTLQQQQQGRKKMLISALLFLALTAGYLGWRSIENRNSNQVETAISTNADIKNQVETFATFPELDEAIIEYESATGNRIWPKGRMCLAKACEGKTKQECLAIIYQNVKL